MFEAIGNHLWQSTLFALVVAALCLLFRSDGAHVRYWLWWIASVKFLVPFSLLTGLGGWLASAASVSAVPGAWTNTVTVIAKPFAAQSGAWSTGTWLLGVWVAGSSALLATWLLRAARLRKLLAEASPDPKPLMNGSRPITVYRSRSGIEPGVVGIVRAALVLPVGLEQRLSASQLEAVLAHELCHIRRRDNLTAAVHMLVEAAFWFHPLVWWIGAKLVDERERACDEMVVALGHDRETYAESILDVCEHYAASPLRCAAGISGSDLKLRVTQIMRYRGMTNLRLTKKLVLGTAGVVAILIPVLAGLALQKAALAQENPPQAAPPQEVAPPAAPAEAAPPQADESQPGIDAADAESREFEPIYRPEPIYPIGALRRGVEGYVIVEYTVDVNGGTKDVVIFEASDPLLERAAIESAQRYRYRPRIFDGAPVEVRGVRTRINFFFARSAGQDDAGDD